MKRNLKNVDLFTLNTIDPPAGLKALKHCMKYFEFGKVIIVSPLPDDGSGIEFHHQDRLPSIQHYSDMMLKAGDYTSNDFLMIIHDDGYVVNPDLWDDAFLDYDYIGAPWPAEASWLQIQGIRSQIEANLQKNRVGNGGFCIRSKKFLDFSKQYSSCSGLGEDIFLCVVKYDDAIRHGIKFAPPELATKFSYENPLKEFDDHSWNEKMEFDATKHFGWHGRNFSNTDGLLRLKDSE
jgi:hypothetical protein